MIIVVRDRNIRVGRGLVLVVVSGGITAVTLLLSGLGAVSMMIVLAAMYPVVWLASKPLSRFIARIGFSIRYKFEIAVAAVSALFLLISLFSYGAMGSMHTEVHNIKDMVGQARASAAGPPGEARGSLLEALDDLANKPHGYLFRLTPIFGSVGVLTAAVLGAAMAWSVIEPVRRIGDSMDRIGSGDFAQPVQVDNRDELGDLAGQINASTQELARLQEAVLAEERTRAFRERMTHVTMAEEEERRRISRELHDGLGPALAAVGNRIRAAKHTVTTDPDETGRQLDEIARSVKGHIQDIRHLIHDLRPLALDQLGLKGALRQHVERFGQDSGIQVSLSASGETPITPLAELTVFRVAQECLTNVQDHAAAGRVDVELQITETILELTVADDGRGFDPDAVSPPSTGKGLGLFSMRERAEALGGSFSLRSGSGKGCVAALLLPIPEVAIGADSSTVS